jgi:hypothetical protein
MEPILCLAQSLLLVAGVVAVEALLRWVVQVGLLVVQRKVAQLQLLELQTKVMLGVHITVEAAARGRQEQQVTALAVLNLVLVEMVFHLQSLEPL